MSITERLIVTFSVASAAIVIAAGLYFIFN